MIPLLTAEEMRSVERQAIEGWGMPSLVLQEHAAFGALAMIPGNEPVHVLAGPGNNGGDALALARLARLQGRQVEVWTLAPEPRWKGDGAVQARLWEGLGGTYRHTAHPDTAIAGFRGWVVDGLFGLGARQPLEGAAVGWVRALQEAVETSGSPGRFKVLALDLPTGLDPSSSDVPGAVVPATLTACFGHLKVCHGLFPAKAFCGEIRILPLPLNAGPKAGLHLIERPARSRRLDWDTHKRDFGHVGIRAGKVGMSGAAVLAALGALRAGAGLVTVLPDPEARAEVACQVPEAMVQPWHGQIPEGIDVLLVGPGGVADIPDWDGPLVLDASALRPGEGPAWMARPQTVVTPHPGEFSRLFNLPKPLGSGAMERLAWATEVATGPGILALKGAQSVVAGGGSRGLLVNPTGHPGLSTGGTGDFLAGIVAAQVARWNKQGDRGLAAGTEGLRGAVAEALWLHGASADRLGPGPLLVRELGESLAALLREIHLEPSIG
jgi:NAD(P)H-hydrate epimerase